MAKKKQGKQTKTMAALALADAGRVRWARVLVVDERVGRNERAGLCEDLARADVVIVRGVVCKNKFGLTTQAGADL